MKFEGIMSALVTPLTAEFEIDEPALRKHVEFQIESGIRGIVMLGGTGEYAALTREQRLEAVRIAIDAAKKRVPVVAGVLEPGYGECVTACKAFEAIGADALRVPEQKVKEIRDTVATLRLDAVTAAGFSMSRGKAAELIAAGRVQKNYREVTKGDASVAQGDVISARGLGKFEVAEVGGLSKKGRTGILLRRYL